MASIIVTAWMSAEMTAGVVPMAAALAAVVVDAPALRWRTMRAGTHPLRQTSASAGSGCTYPRATKNRSSR